MVQHAHVTHPTQAFRSHRDFENRGITMAVIVLLIGLLTLLMGVGFSAWNWASLSHFYTSKLYFATFVLSIIVGTFYLVILLLSALTCALAVIWFTLWIAPAAPKLQTGTLSLIAFLLMLLALIYFVNLILGIAIFGLRLGDYMTIAWYASFAGLLFTLVFLCLVAGAIKATRGRSIESIEGRHHAGVAGLEPASSYHSSVRTGVHHV